MSVDFSLLTQKTRRITYCLLISGLVNIGLLLLLFYKGTEEDKPAPFFDIRTIHCEEQPIALESTRALDETLLHLSSLSFEKLLDALTLKTGIDNGCKERDLALACMASFHHFDVERALSGIVRPEKKRLLFWQGSALPLYIDLEDSDYAKIISFAREEEWPLDSEGLYLCLKKTPSSHPSYKTLVDTFILSREYLYIEQLFKPLQSKLKQKELIALILESDWALLSKSYKEHDLSEKQRRIFLLLSAMKGSNQATHCLIAHEASFALLLSDHELMILIQSLGKETPGGSHFVRNVLKTPRSPSLKKVAEKWLEGQKEIIQPLSAPAQPKRPPVAKTAPVQKQKTPSPYFEYTVQEGDSLWKVAKLFKMDVETLKRINKLESERLKPGMKLKVKNPHAN